MEYNLVKECNEIDKKKVFLIFDVPSHLHLSEQENEKNIGILKPKQYAGFYCDLRNYNDLNAYLLEVLSAKTRNKFKRYRRKLEDTFEIRYKFYTGAIEKDLHNQLFSTFNELLKKRFKEKKTVNNNLYKWEWDFYEDVSFSMIQEKKAAFFVTYDKEKPIAITLLFLSKNRVYDTIRVFDTDYSQHRLGTVSIMAQIEECIERGFSFLDFSKGYYPYKEQWSNVAYHFEYHIIYNKSVLKSKILAYYLSSIFALKQLLRDFKINEVHQGLKFKLGLHKNKYSSNTNLA
ncbi:GNAT family N-acetyltransferase [Flagellimonas meridianipacifica]|nr:GNAT family N-acetyltransferase [Allomuricauda pacifica]